LTPDPKPRKDGTCVECGKPKKRTRKAATGARKIVTGHTRQDLKMWLAHLEADPFCSRPCLERYHQLIVERGPLVCDRAGCDATFVPLPNQPRQRFCSERCRNANQKAPKFNVPGRCLGCGGDKDEYVNGCSHCADRKRRRIRRLDPAYLAAERTRDRDRRRKKARQRMYA
jgi:hypothetical protein